MQWFACIAAVMLTGLLVKARQRVAGTTLAAPANWAIVAAAAIAVFEGIIAVGRGEAMSPFAESALRYTASCATLMPMIAVLGAKRPQDRGWPWVVAALWITLLVPVAQLFVAKATGPLELPRFWGIVVGVCIAMGLLNYLATRNLVPALLVAWGQWQMFRSTMFAYAAEVRTYDRLAPVACFALALVAARVFAKYSRSSDGGVNRRWRAFRDGWGAFWALRVMQRLNQSAEAAKLPERLEWSGWKPADGDALSDSGRTQIEQAMDAVLWRFEATPLTLDAH